MRTLNPNLKAGSRVSQEKVTRKSLSIVLKWFTRGPRPLEEFRRETPEFTRKSSLRLDLRKYRVYILDGASHIECARRVK